MAGSGRISLLIDSPLRTANLAFRGLEPEVRKQITRHIKPVADAAWKEEVNGRVLSKLQARVLGGTARVGVSGLSVSLTSGGAGKLSSGTGTGTLSRAVEHGANPEKLVQVRTRKGTTFQRRLGDRFARPRRGGYVVYPAAREAIARVAALVVQTTIRTVHETRERLGS